MSCGDNKARTGSRTPKVAPLDPWVITNLDPNVETPALLWNGLIGVRLATLKSPGSAFFDIAAYQPSGEEKIIPLQSPLRLHIESGGSDFHPEASTDFTETLHLNTGEIVQTWKQAPINWYVEVRSAIHPTRRLFAQRWILGPSKDADIRVTSFATSGSLKVISSTGETRRMELTIDQGTFQILDRMTNQRPGKWSEEGGLPTWRGSVDSDPALVFERVVSFDKSPLDDTVTYEQIATSSKDALVGTVADIEIEGPIEDQQFIRSALFYLRGSVHPTGKMSISPMGLSSDIYNGHVFWDADIWVFPALALIDPERAKRIPAYRLSRLAQATENFGQWVDLGMPTGNGKVLGRPNPSGARTKWIDGAKYPWESSVTGRETVPGPSKFQDHITGSVAWSLGQGASLGLVTEAQSESLRKLAAQFFATRSTPPKPFQILDTMSPDENHTGNNDLYTNLLAMWCTNGGKWPDPPTYKLPKDEKTFLTYDNDALRGYKQAAAVLSIYPLQYPPAEKQARAMMDRFADKVTKNGPAMTDSIHAVIWARLGEKDRAYEAWHDSWKPFVKPPFLLFSEKRNSSRTYFTTGAAGSLQAVLFGFAGLRIDDRVPAGSKWSMPLRGGKFLSIKPNLPAAWKKLTLRNLSVLGKKLTFEIVGDSVKVTNS